MKAVAVAAGHYPDKPGAVWEGVTEHKLALEWQDLLCNYLMDHGIDATPVDSGPLPHKIKQINSGMPQYDLALEIHFNSDPKHAGKGSESLYYPGSKQGLDWAESIQRAISTFCDPNRGAKEGWYRMDRPGHSDYPGDVDGDEVVDYFLRKTNCPAVILEPYFIHETARIEANASIVCAVMADIIEAKLREP